jgi:hypothetical protein
MYPERGEIQVKDPKGEANEQEKTFTFDIVIHPKALQDLVFNQTALPIVESVLEGYNGTIFAYG